MNILQETIEKLEVKDPRSELEDILLALLQEKAGALGEDPSDEAAEWAVIQAKKELRQYLRSRECPEKEEDAAMIRALLESLGTEFREYDLREDVRAFELKLVKGKNSLKVRLCLIEDPRACRMEAVYPFRAKAEYAYPLCVQLAKESYQRRFGGLYYDETDGELSYRCSFPITHGLNEEDLQLALTAVVAGALDSYPLVKRYAAGQFHLTERQEAICKAQQLILGLDL